jgi:hypothetical protein
VGRAHPLVGPYFSYAYAPDSAWTLTAGRIWLEIVPGAAALLGGIILLVSAMRPMAMTGALLAAIGGAWFAVGRAAVGGRRSRHAAGWRRRRHGQAGAGIRRCHGG